MANELIENKETDLASQLNPLDEAPVEDSAPMELEFTEAEVATAESTEPFTSELLDATELQSCIEALLFMSEKSMPLKRLQELLGPQFEASVFEEAIQNLKDRYQNTHHGIELVEVGGGYQLRTKISRASLAQKLVRVQTQRLSAGGMETIAIIAYKQPVMKEEVDKIRGVDSSYFIRGLMEKKLIEITGRSELPGRPLLYSTTNDFLEVFGLRDLAALPSLRELEQMVPASESNNPDGETPQTREMRRLVNAMNMDRTSALHYNPQEDEKILKEIRERVSAIAVSTPYLDELKQAEQEAKLQELAATEAQVTP